MISFSLKQGIFTVGSMLTMLFVFIEPAASMGLGFFERVIFWALHIGTGMAALYCSSLIIERVSFNAPLPVLLILSGLIGALAATPVYWGLDHYFEQSYGDNWLDELEQNGVLSGLLAEFLTIGPTMLSVWLLLNIPLMRDKPVLSDVIDNNFIDDTLAKEKQRDFLNNFYERLPEVIGKDIVAISSDLHYLIVYTRKGRTLVHGSLKKHSEALGEMGILIHRSHWVAKKHVEGYVHSGEKAFCKLSNGMALPVSRSKRKEAKAIFGDINTKKAEVVSFSIKPF